VVLRSGGESAEVDAASSGMDADSLLLMTFEMTLATLIQAAAEDNRIQLYVRVADVPLTVRDGSHGGKAWRFVTLADDDSDHQCTLRLYDAQVCRHIEGTRGCLRTEYTQVLLEFMRRWFLLINLVSATTSVSVCHG
jgi:hypothetical protein